MLRNGRLPHRLGLRAPGSRQQEGVTSPAQAPLAEHAPQGGISSLKAGALGNWGTYCKVARVRREHRSSQQLKGRAGAAPSSSPLPPAQGASEQAEGERWAEARPYCLPSTPFPNSSHPAQSPVASAPQPASHRALRKPSTRQA